MEIRMIFNSKVTMRPADNQVLLKDEFIMTKSGGKHRVQTTKVWKVLIFWNDGSTTWTTLKDSKEYYY